MQYHGMLCNIGFFFINILFIFCRVLLMLLTLYALYLQVQILSLYGRTMKNCWQTEAHSTPTSTVGTQVGGCGMQCSVPFYGGVLKHSQKLSTCKIVKFENINLVILTNSQLIILTLAIVLLWICLHVLTILETGSLTHNALGFAPEFILHRETLNFVLLPVVTISVAKHSVDQPISVVRK